jgi:hypothetical protein
MAMRKKGNCSKNVRVTPDTGTGTDPEPAPFFRENIDM